jgi:hypothetical protein
VRLTLPILVSLLATLSSCYHMKNARFVDESDLDPSATVWICVADDVEPTNVAGLMCADLRNVPPSPPKPEKAPEERADSEIEWRLAQPRVISLGSWDPVPLGYEMPGMDRFPVDRLVVP